MLVEDGAAKKRRAGHHAEVRTYQGMVFLGENGLAMADIITSPVHHQGIAKGDHHIWVGIKIVLDHGQSLRQVLLERTYVHQIELFFEIVGLLADGKELPISDETWPRPPFTRVQFNELFVIRPDMSKDEIARRIRAISYKHWQPFLEIQGYRFEYKPG